MVPAQQRVSIHALLAECDHIRCGLCPGHSSFNPRTPCGVRPSFRGRWWRHTRFQSTHSLRSATGEYAYYQPGNVFQSTHSLRSATGVRVRPVVGDEVSIHALLAECDPGNMPTTSRAMCFNPRTPCGVRQPEHAGPAAGIKFQSTHSLRSATFDTLPVTYQDTVSIHALLAECDRIPIPLSPYGRSFNPRTPCGVRRMPGMMWPTATTFQSTHSLRSATAAIASMGFTRSFQSTHSLRSATHPTAPSARIPTVSIHALLAECDERWTCARRFSTGFNPRTPCGVRPLYRARCQR